MLQLIILSLFIICAQSANLNATTPNQEKPLPRQVITHPKYLSIINHFPVSSLEIHNETVTVGNRDDYAILTLKDNAVIETKVVRAGNGNTNGKISVKDSSELNVKGPILLGSGPVDGSGTGILEVQGKVTAGSIQLSPSSKVGGSTVTDIRKTGALEVSGGNLSITKEGVVATGSVTGNQPGDSINLDGGTLQARYNNNKFVSGPGLFRLGPGGGNINTDGFHVGITSVISGSGDLYITGEGRLTFMGENKNTGNTVVHEKTTLILGVNNASSPNSDLCLYGPEDKLEIHGKTATIGALLGNGRVTSVSHEPVLGKQKREDSESYDNIVEAILERNKPSNPSSVAASGANTVSNERPRRSAENAIAYRTGGVPVDVKTLSKDAGNNPSNANVKDKTFVDLVETGAYLLAMSLGDNKPSSNSEGERILVINATNRGLFEGSLFGGSIEDGKYGVSVIKTGTGTQIFTGDNTYTGTTDIKLGELMVDGKLASSIVRVAPDGVLSGSGVLAGDVVNSGAVSPGDSIGTLTIKGNYTQTASGTLFTDIFNAKADLLAVKGSVFLGGDLDIETYSEPTKEGYKIIEGREINGEFSEVRTPDDLVVGVIYDASEVYLLVLGKGTPLRMTSLEKFAPQIAGNIKDVLFNVTNAQYMQLTARLAAIRSGVSGLTLQNLSQEPMQQQYNKRTLSCGDKTVAVANEELPWNIWASASGVLSRINNLSDLPRLNSITGYFSLGADYRINPYLNVGAYTGYQIGYTRSSNGRLKNNGIKLGLYGTAQWNGFYLNGIVGGGANFFNVKHSANFADHEWKSQGNPFAVELDSLLGAGYEHRWNSWTFGINNSIQYTNLGISSFTQTMAKTTRGTNLDVKMDGQKPSSLVYTLGGNVSYRYEIAPEYQITPTVGMYWQHEFLNKGQRIGARYTNGLGVPFYFNSRSAARNNAYGNFGITAQLGRWFGTFAYYQPQFGGNHIYSNNFVIGANVGF